MGLVMSGAVVAWVMDGILRVHKGSVTSILKRTRGTPERVVTGTCTRNKKKNSRKNSKSKRQSGMLRREIRQTFVEKRLELLEIEKLLRCLRGWGPCFFVDIERFEHCFFVLLSEKSVQVRLSDVVSFFCECLEPPKRAEILPFS